MAEDGGRAGRKRAVPSSRKGVSKYEFSKMAVGECYEPPVSSSIAAVQIAALTAGKLHGMKFRTSKCPDGVLRVWRIR